MEETSVTLPKYICDCRVSYAKKKHLHRLTHRNREQTDHNLNTGNGHECVECAVLNKPVVGAEGQPETEEILEHDQAGEGLDCDFP